MNKHLLRLALLPLCLTAAGATQAHHLWIEQPAATDERAAVRFGEFAANLREASPGLLDKFGEVRATLLDGRETAPVAAVKAADGWLLPVRAAAGQSLVAEDARYPLYAAKQAGQPVTHWYYPAARLVTTAAALPPTLRLDLVPTGEPGRFQAFFRGQPLPQAKVTLATPSGWAKEQESDEQGLVRFDLPWQGAYVAEVSHQERSDGERPGAQGTPERYDGVNYVTSLTVLQAQGLTPLPAGPAQAPHR
ncbi:DUF4198 domain-containing protein [Aquincola tertiaricarbonis]|uniref:DUF4198 domain-containing protein n=1 Tax=Aquincola tertiaricarbonis TaxID=391953 RepID=UPI0006151430|nr:DUF4198 domain-containing protein [Aquincola tertiaricarbonis]